MDLHIIDSTGALVEIINLPTKTTLQCISKFQYLYNHTTDGTKIYSPYKYTGHNLYVDNSNDSKIYLVHPNNNHPNNTTLKLTIGSP